MILYSVGEVPDFTTKHNLDNVLRVVLSGYRKEVQIQRPFGGIRNPVGVFHNKLRHELTNYDTIRDYISNAVADGYLDFRRSLEIREALIEQMYGYVDDVIRKLPLTIRVPDDAPRDITRPQIVKYNDDWGVREIERITSELSSLAG